MQDFPEQEVVAMFWQRERIGSASKAVLGEDRLIPANPSPENSHVSGKEACPTSPTSEIPSGSTA
jgi:hypothetical protein